MNVVTLELSKHASHRAKNRAISPQSVEAVIDLGREYNAGAGCLGYFLSGNMTRSMEHNSDLNLDRSRGLAVILAGARIVTIQHCGRPPRSWRPTHGH